MTGSITGAHGTALGGGALVAAPTVNPTEVLRRMARADYLFRQPKLLGMFEAADAGRPLHNTHGLKHGMNVWATGGGIARQCRFSATESHRTSICSALHDLGCCDGHVGHEKTSERLVGDLMLAEGASLEDALVCSEVVGGHRTAHVIGHGVNRNELAALIIADRTHAADEFRVRDEQAAELEGYLSRGPEGLDEWRARELRERKHSGPDGHAHVMHVRGAYGVRGGTNHRPRVYVNNTACSMMLRIELKEWRRHGAAEATKRRPHPFLIIRPDELLDLFGQKYLACHLAAEYLGYGFQLMIGRSLYCWTGSEWGVIESYPS